jgi:hypothetical protein
MTRHHHHHEPPTTFLQRTGTAIMKRKLLASLSTGLGLLIAAMIGEIGVWCMDDLKEIHANIGHISQLTEQVNTLTNQVLVLQREYWQLYRNNNENMKESNQ